MSHTTAHTCNDVLPARCRVSYPYCTPTQTWPGPKTPVPGLHVCGDSCMPGIGVPAAAASGMITANSLAPVWAHLGMMDTLVPR